MADNNTRINGPVTLQSDGADRVAFDLMEKIAQYDKVPSVRDEKYWLSLYRHCWLITHGSKLEDALET